MSEIEILPFASAHLEQLIKIWNSIVAQGETFPQKEPLDMKDGFSFFSSQTFTGVAVKDHRVFGFYILHPNNIGRCSKIANASYGVIETARGQGIGKKLVLHSLKTAKEKGFRILQFNAVVKTNHRAISLYKALGFKELGTIPGAYENIRGNYEDIVLFYFNLMELK